MQDEKGPDFITGHEGQEERPRRNAFKLTQTFLSTEDSLVFLR